MFTLREPVLYCYEWRCGVGEEEGVAEEEGGEGDSKQLTDIIDIYYSFFQELPRKKEV